MSYSFKNRISMYLENTEDGLYPIEKYESSAEKYETGIKMGFDKKELEKDVESWVSNLELKVNSREERLGQIYPRYKDKCYEGELIPVVISFPDLAERVIGVNELADLYNISKSKYAKKLLIHTSLENECDSVRSLAQEHLGYSDFRLGIYKNINKLKGIRENGDLAKGIFFGGVLAFLFYEFYILLRNIAE